MRSYDTTTTCWVNTQKYDISKHFHTALSFSVALNTYSIKTTRLSLDQVDTSLFSFP